ncbi:hypothetical protein ASF32_00090 [Methylobacterium sp. Leaf91]|nr:hypothetical protein ASF32_00090 [Methylobacterium sp. Leaf91]
MSTCQIMSLATTQATLIGYSSSSTRLSADTTMQPSLQVPRIDWIRGDQNYGGSFLFENVMAL